MDIRYVLGLLGRVFKRQAVEAASPGRRWDKAPQIPSLNSAIAASAAPVRRRATASVINNPWAKSGVTNLVANLVGKGIVPQANGVRQEAALKLWQAWAADADISGVTNFAGLQMMAVKSMVEAGECFVRLRVLPDDGRSPVPLALELITPEQVPATFHLNLTNGNRIRCGVEFDPFGRRVAYHVLPVRLDDPYAPLAWTGYQTIRLPAEDVIHLFEPLAPGQVRGLSWLAPVMLRLHEIDQLTDAALVREKVAALMVAFMTDPDGDGAPMAATAAPGAPGGAVMDSEMEPGTILSLPPGKSIEFTDPPDSTALETVLKVHLRSVAAGLGVLYESLAGDLEGVTFSSIRHGLLEVRRRYEQLQHAVIIHQFCRPTWHRFITVATLTGALPVRDLDEMLSIKWSAPAWPWIDPQADVSAEVDAINGKLKSRAQAVAERGYSVATVDAEIAADLQRERDLGIIPPTPEAPANAA